MLLIKAIKNQLISQILVKLKSTTRIIKKYTFVFSEFQCTNTTLEVYYTIKNKYGAESEYYYFEIDGFNKFTPVVPNNKIRIGMRNVLNLTSNFAKYKKYG